MDEKKLKLISLAALIYGLPIYVFSVFPFSKKIYPDFEFFHSPIFSFLLTGRVQFSSLGIIADILLLYCVFLLFIKKNIVLENERVWLIWTGLKKVASNIFLNKLKQPVPITKEERVSLLFYLVKLFWAPLMIIFAINNATDFYNLLRRYSIWDFNAQSFLNLYFPLYISAIFILDTVIFSCGYLFESPALKNVTKSVEPTVLGWVFALACYGPFFDTFTRIAGPLPQDFADFKNVSLNVVFGLITILFFSIYVWASTALGFKASNLTNRGIVSKGPYKYVRHPAYISKNLGWWAASIPLMGVYGWKVVVGLAVWTFVYYVRSITEERHLLQDPDYVEYCKKVKYMFIPGVI